MAEAVNAASTEAKPDSWFFTWMAEFRLGERTEIAQKRWKSIGEICDRAQSKEVESLVRLAWATKQKPDPAVVAALEADFQKQDPEFSAANNARELQVLAACTLIFLANDIEDNYAPAAGLAMAIAAMDGQRKATLPGDLKASAINAMRTVSAGAARRPMLPTSLGQQYKALFETATAKAKAQPDWNGLTEALSLAGGTTTATLNQIQTRAGAAFKTLEMRLNQQDEELQMLWWLIGERSEEFDCAFDALPTEYRPIALGKELADHTLTPPGPPSVRALLSRARLAGRSKVGLVDAVKACPLEWLQGFVNAAPAASPVTQPIHFAFQRQLETGPGDTWVAGWAAVTELPQSLSMTPLALAELVYRERLLMRFYE